MTYYYLCKGDNNPYQDGYVSITAPTREIANMLFECNFPNKKYYRRLTEDDIKSLNSDEWEKQTCHQAIGIFIENHPSIIPLLIKDHKEENGSFYVSA